jgi:hypothetical protein
MESRWPFELRRLDGVGYQMPGAWSDFWRRVRSIRYLGRTGYCEQPTALSRWGWTSVRRGGAGRAKPQQPSGPPKPIENGSGVPEPAASSDAANRSVATKDMAGLLCSMPAGNTLANRSFPHFRLRSHCHRDFLTWCRALCPSSLTAQIKQEKLMIVPGTADGFRARVGALRFLDGSKGVSFHTFSLPEDRCVHLLIRTLGRPMPDSVVREDLQALGVRVQWFMQLRSWPRDQVASKDRPLTYTRCSVPLTPHFIISTAHGAEVHRVGSLAELCSLGVSVATYIAPIGRLQCNRCQRLGRTLRN